MNEQEPEMKLIIGEEERVLTRFNTHLYLHLGASALYDHIYVVGDSDGGTYIPSTAKGFTEVRDFLIDNLYPLHANLPFVAEGDKEVLESFWLRDLVQLDTLPDSWTSDGTPECS